MTPIAAYYIFIANENERTGSPGRRPVPRQRPSLLQRIRSLATGLRAQPSLPRPA